MPALMYDLGCFLLYFRITEVFTSPFNPIVQISLLPRYLPYFFFPSPNCFCIKSRNRIKFRLQQQNLHFCFLHIQQALQLDKLLEDDAFVTTVCSNYSPTKSVKWVSVILFWGQMITFWHFQKVWNPHCDKNPQFIQKFTFCK